jgi:hypothetical protein
VNEVKHIKWLKTHDNLVSGILRLRVYWHGGGETEVVLQGVFNQLEGEFKNTSFGLKLSSNTTGVSGVSLIGVMEELD